MNKTDIAHAWKSRGFTCDIWNDPPGQCWEGYVHKKDELFMLLEGDIELEIEGEILYPAIGNEILIPAKVVHSVRNVGKSTAWWFYGYKDPEPPSQNTIMYSSSRLS